MLSHKRLLSTNGNFPGPSQRVHRIEPCLAPVTMLGARWLLTLCPGSSPAGHLGQRSLGSFHAGFGGRHALPGNFRTGVVEEPVLVGATLLFDHLDDPRRAVFDRHRRTLAAHVGPHPTGVQRYHGQVPPAQFTP